MVFALSVGMTSKCGHHCVENVSSKLCQTFIVLSMEPKMIKNIRVKIKKYPNTQRHLFGVNSNSHPKLININKMLFLLIVWDIIDLNYEDKTEESPPSITLSLAKLSPLCPGTCLMDEGFWTNIIRREPLMDYNL